MDIQGKNILVTGGAGFIGSHLVDTLIAKKPEKIVVVDNFFLGQDENLAGAKERFSNLTVYPEDASDYAAMEYVMQNEAIDAVFNLAVKPLPYSFVNPEGAYMTSVRIANVFSNLLRKGAYQTLVHFSSSEAFGTAVQVPMTEEHPLHPTTPYSAGKAAADLLVMSYYRTFGLDIRVLRPFNNYGPRQNEQLYAAIIPMTIRRILKGESPVLEGDGLQTRDFLYASDTAEAAIRMLETDATKGLQINIASGRETTMKEIIDTLCEIMQYSGKIERRPERPGDLRRHCGGISLAEKTIGFQPKVSLHEGLQKTLDWYQAKKA